MQGKGDEDMKQFSPQEKNLLSTMLENELDEFFQERAEIKAVHVSDKSKQAIGEARDQDPDPDQESACCYSACPSCPWGYQI